MRFRINIEFESDEIPDDDATFALTDALAVITSSYLALKGDIEVNPVTADDQTWLNLDPKAKMPLREFGEMLCSLSDDSIVPWDGMSDACGMPVSSQEILMYAAAHRLGHPDEPFGPDEGNCGFEFCPFCALEEMERKWRRIAFRKWIPYTGDLGKGKIREFGYTEVRD